MATAITTTANIKTAGQADVTKDESKITTGGMEYVNKHAAALEKVFHQDPVIIYLLCNLTDERRIAYMPEYFTILYKAAALNDATLQEIDNWAACAIWLPPRKRVDSWATFIPSGLYKTLFQLGFRGVKRQLGYYSAYTNRIKHIAMHGRKDWIYCFFIGTQEDHRKKGLASKLIKNYQEVARSHEKGPLPIWLEATTETSMRLYVSLGFQLVHELRLGVGNVGADGRQKPGGEGVPLWMLIWEPFGEKNPATEKNW